MKLLGWNVQGFVAKDTRDYLADIIREHDPHLIFLSKTKIEDSDRAKISVTKISIP